MAEKRYIELLPYLHGPRGGPIEKRFWSAVTKAGDEDCWLWQNSLNTSGYGRFKIASHQQITAHRLAYAMAFNVEPGDLFVCHHCDAPACVNPQHLFLGTAEDNNLDKMAKGRWRGSDQSGEKNGMAILKASDIPGIVALFKAGKNNKQISQIYGVHHATISRIRVGLTWVDECAAAGWEGSPQFKRKGSVRWVA